MTARKDPRRGRRFSIWLGWNATLAAGVWFGIVANVQLVGALFQLVLIVFTAIALLTVATAMTLTDDDIESMIVMPRWYYAVNLVFDVALLVAIAASGWFLTSVVWAIYSGAGWVTAGIVTDRRRMLHIQPTAGRVLL